MSKTTLLAIGSVFLILVGACDEPRPHALGTPPPTDGSVANGPVGGSGPTGHPDASSGGTGGFASPGSGGSGGGNGSVAGASGSGGSGEGGTNGGTPGSIDGPSGGGAGGNMTVPPADASVPPPLPDAASPSPDSAAPMPSCMSTCAPGNTRCQGGVQPCVMMANGCADWGAVTDLCTGRACAQGACTGNCEPGKTQCAGPQGTQPQVCTGAGVWANGGSASCKKPNGQGCSGSSDCVNGNCVMGICCATQCPAAGAGQCGNTGFCDGGTCRKNAGASCGRQECSDSREAGFGTCNGSGVCANRANRPCPGGLVCEGSTRCAETCVVGLAGGSCPSDRFCESERRCSPRVGQHKVCRGIGSGECSNGLSCTAGFCCRGTCIAPGQRCTRDPNDCASGLCNYARTKVCSNDPTRTECDRVLEPPIPLAEYCGSPDARCIDGIDLNKSFCGP